MFKPSAKELAPTVVAACAAMHQGDLLRDVPVSWTYSADHPVTLLAKEQVNSASSIVPVTLPLAIITIQTCDLQNTKRMMKSPFVSVAPVYDAQLEFASGEIGNIKRGKYGYLIPLDAVSLTHDDHIWVVDIRFEFPVERGLLVGREAGEGFKDDEGRLNFQRSLGKIRLRNSIDDNVRAFILLPLRAMLEESQEFSDLIEEIRIAARPRLTSASAVDLHILICDEADPVTVQEQIDRWAAQARIKIPLPLRLIDISVQATSSFTRADQLNTERLDLDDLTE